MKRVLVADPDCSFLKTIGMMLREEFDISHARTPKAVLQKAKEVQPDVIILGCFAPRGQSFTLHNKLRKEECTASIPILVVDVPARDHLRKGWKRTEGLQMQAEGYLSRPLDPRTLNSEVKRVMESRSAGMLNWAQILEQTERNLLKEMDRWNGSARHPSAAEQTEQRQSRRNQAVEMKV